MKYTKQYLVQQETIQLQNRISSFIRNSTKLEKRLQGIMNMAIERLKTGQKLYVSNER